MMDPRGVSQIQKGKGESWGERGRAGYYLTNFSQKLHESGKFGQESV